MATISCVTYLADNTCTGQVATVGSITANACHVDAGSAFRYIQDVLEEGSMSRERATAFKAAVLESIVALAQISASQAATLLLLRFPDSHVPVVQSLQDTPQLQFSYLQAADQVCCIATSTGWSAQQPAIEAAGAHMSPYILYCWHVH